MIFKCGRWNIVFYVALLLSTANTISYAAISDKSVQIDLLMSKITTLIEAKQESKTLPYFSQLEAMDTPLPESFYYYYIDTLDKSGDSKKALSRAETYLNTYGKKGKYYTSVLAIMTRLSIQVEQDTAARAALTEFKNTSIAEFRSLESDFARIGGSATIGGVSSAYESDIKRLVTRFKEASTAYFKRVMKPSIDRLQVLLKKRDTLAAGEQRDNLDIEIKQVNDDIGLVQNLNTSFLASVYAGMERFGLKSDARTIEDVRLRSYLYSKCDGKNNRFFFDEIEGRIATQTAKFNVTISEW